MKLENCKEYNLQFKTLIILILIQILLCLINSINEKLTQNNDKRIGIIGFENGNNIGNNMVKYSMYILLKSLGFKPTLISLKQNINIYFLRKYLNIKEINNYYTDLNESDYDFLVVNSDQVWSCYYKYLLEVGFLSFAYNWNVSKFVYAASLGHDVWEVSKKVLLNAKKLVKQFTGISVREQKSVNLIKNYLGIEPNFVLDPTFLIDKNEYLKLIKNFKIDLDLKKNYLCAYILDKNDLTLNFINKASNFLNYTTIYVECEVDNYIEKFFYHYNLCQSIITDSFHGTVFSIIFNKPFITFINKRRGSARFSSLNTTFQIYNRIIYPRTFNYNDTDILTKSPNINITEFNRLKENSLKYIKKNLKLIE